MWAAPCHFKMFLKQEDALQHKLVHADDSRLFNSLIRRIQLIGKLVCVCHGASLFIRWHRNWESWNIQHVASSPWSGDLHGWQVEGKDMFWQVIEAGLQCEPIFPAQEKFKFGAVNLLYTPIGWPFLYCSVTLLFFCPAVLSYRSCTQPCLLCYEGHKEAHCAMLSIWCASCSTLMYRDQIVL